VCMIWKDDPEARNYIKRPKNMRVHEDQSIALGELNEEVQNEFEAKSEIHLTIDTKESQENSVYCVVLFLSLFFTLSFNFFY
jgi:hypothetical protein